MFLNIDYDKWHGIIAAVGMVLIFSAMWIPAIFGRWVIGAGFIEQWGKVWTAIGFMGVAFAIAHWMQCWNESRQARDPHLLDKYKSWEHFVDDSRNDFRWFWRGTVVSLVANMVIFLLTA